MAELVGRTAEMARVMACLKAGRNILLEGPVGVGKTALALAAVARVGRPHFRVDGDGRYTEQKLTGWFDPPAVLAKGYGPESFVAGPLVEAMRAGGVLFINELNRLPEGVQNVLLPAIDEKSVAVPRLGEERAASGFCVIATQNPKEFVATTHLSEAILDRFELVPVDYPPQDEELAIVRARCSKAEIAKLAVRLARLSRSDAQVRRGASVRAAISVAELTDLFSSLGADAFREAARTALPTRIEIEREEAGSGLGEVLQVIERLVDETLAGAEPRPSAREKKN